MSNTRILYVLIFLALASILGRWWMRSYRGDWEDAVERHKSAWETIVATSDELKARRPNAPTGDVASMFRTHFQSVAFQARMGTIEVQQRRQERNAYEDLVFDIAPQDTESTFDRQQLRLFLFNSEVQFPRLRTTGLGIQPVPRTGRTVPTGAEREDRWRITKLEFRHRTPTGEED